MRLRRSDLTGPGIRRIRSGRGFRYLDASCQPVPAAELARIKDLVIPPAWKLVIPPAWKEVWICPWPNGHIQAVGFDAAGRRQYLYHPRWRERRDKQKHDHVLDFAAALPDARQIVIAQLAGRGLTRERVLAASVRLLDLGFFRVGGERYAEDNGTYGLATLRREHVSFSHGQIVVIERYDHGDTIVNALDQLGGNRVRSPGYARRDRGGRAQPAQAVRLGQRPLLVRARSGRTQLGQPLRGGGDPLVGGGQRHPDVPGSRRAP